MVTVPLPANQTPPSRLGSCRVRLPQLTHADLTIMPAGVSADMTLGDIGNAKDREKPDDGGGT